MGEVCQGRCFCGSVRFEIEPPVRWSAARHCESRRRQCSAPMTAQVGVDDGRWSWTRGAPKLHRSSPGVERTFCADCGSPLSFRSANMTGLMHFFLAALEDPERFPPQLHLAIEEKRCWLALADDLPNREGPSVAPPD